MSNALASRSLLVGKEPFYNPPPFLLLSKICNGFCLKIVRIANGQLVGLFADENKAMRVGIKGVPTALRQEDVPEAMDLVNNASLRWNGTDIWVHVFGRGGGCGPSTLSGEKEPLLKGVPIDTNLGGGRISELGNQAYQLKQQGNQAEAIRYYKAAVEGAEAIAKAKNLWNNELEMPALNLACYLQELERHVEAVPYFEKYSSYPKLPNEQNLALLNLGKAYKLATRYPEAVQTLSALYPRLSHPNLEIPCLTHRSEAYAAMGKVEDAITDRQRILENQRDPKEKVATLYAIGNIYFANRQYEKARGWYSQFLERVKGLFGENSKDEAICLRMIAETFLSEKKYPEALETYQKALDAAKVAYGESDPEYAYTLQSLGATKRFLGMYDEAIQAHEKAYAILNAKYKGRDVTVANVLTSLGKDYFAKEDWSKAIEIHEQAVAIYDALRQSKEAVEALTQIGDAYVKLGQQDKATPYHERVLQLSSE